MSRADAVQSVRPFDILIGDIPAIVEFECHETKFYVATVAGAGDPVYRRVFLLMSWEGRVWCRA